MVKSVWVRWRKITLIKDLGRGDHIAFAWSFCVAVQVYPTIQKRSCPMKPFPRWNSRTRRSVYLRTHLTNGCTIDWEKAHTLTDTVKVPGDDAETPSVGPREEFGGASLLAPSACCLCNGSLQKSTRNASSLFFVRAKFLFTLFSC